MRGPRRQAPPAPGRLQPGPAVAGVPAYRRAPRRPGIDLILDGNEGAPPDPALWIRLQDQAAELMVRYPDAAALEADLARRLDVAPGQVLVTAGADDALHRACRAVLGPGLSMVVPSPTFAMLPLSVRRSGGEVIPVPWPGGPYPVDRVIAATTPATRAVAVVSPSNPTGGVATADDLARLRAALPGVLLLVDLAYVEFADHDLTAAALALPDTLVIRTLSKAWGLAGLRVGYAVGPAPILDWLRAAGEPYAVAGPSLALAAGWLRRGEAAVAKLVARVRQERERLASTLSGLGARPRPTQANFVLARFDDAARVRSELAALGIAVRAFTGDGDLADALRITCPGRERDMARLERALTTVLRPQALLLDMDGVLADVSGSYRAAILATAGQFGVSLTPGEVAAAKEAGDANDDWELTRRLLSARGVDRPLPEVRSVFEEIYQGTPGAPGLRRTEALACGRAFLERLAGRLPLAIVTGRPREDAERFLEEQGIGHLFTAVVSRDDGPIKPDPAPVRAALDRLGVASAWMVGDTVDDMRAARAAGVLPLGCVAPGDDRQRTTAALTAAGAGAVLERLEDLEGRLP